MIMILRRVPHLHLREFTTPCHRLLSTSSPPASSPNPNPNPHFSAVDYLIQSCGLSLDQALRASNKINHLKSPNKPDAVLRFLREVGIAEPDIRKAVFGSPRLLCSSVGKNWRPNIEKLKDVGLPMHDISLIVSRCSHAFQGNVVPKIDFWMQSLGSVKNVFVVFKRRPALLTASLEKVLVPNLSFLQEQLGLSVSQIVLPIRMSPYFIRQAPKALTVKLERAKELGLSPSSRMFVYALVLVSNHKQHCITAKVNNFKSFGFTHEEVTILVSKNPTVLFIKKETMAHKLEFLLKELGLDKLHVIRNVSLPTLSLEKRLIPCNLVLKLLEAKGFPVATKNFATVAMLNEKQFVKNTVVPYENTFPGLQRAYTEACSGKSSAREWFKVSQIDLLSS